MRPLCAGEPERPGVSVVKQAVPSHVFVVVDGAGPSSRRARARALMMARLGRIVDSE